MNPMDKLDPHLLETLSAYLDGRLEGAEKAALKESADGAADGAGAARVVVTFFAPLLPPQAAAEASTKTMRRTS